jgi:putative transcriptional regulator
MKKPKTKFSVGARIVQRLQDFAEALESGEDLPQRFRVHQVSLNFKPTVYDATLVKQTRELLGASCDLFAQFLGVSGRTVRSWEQGATAPGNVARRFMDEIRANPTYWRERIRHAAISR